MIELTEEYLESIGFKESHEDSVLIWEKDNIELMRTIDNEGFYIGIDGNYELPRVNTIEELKEILREVNNEVNKS